MRLSKLRLAALALASGVTLGGCAYGFGDPYGSYGSLGVGYGDYGYGYGYPYSRYGYGYGGYPFGWYDGWYYPGTGYYVYDPDRRRRVITDAERQYWREKFARMRTGTSGTTTTTATTSITPRENWSGFKRIRTRSVDTTRTTTRGSERSRWNRPSTTSSSDTTSSRSSSRSSDFMRRHAPKNKD